MANLTATLYITIKTKAGKWTTVKPAMSDNGRLKKLVAVVDAKEEKHPEGQYKVRWLENGKPALEIIEVDLRKVDLSECGIRARVYVGKLRE
jgi:hypothetical protein